MLPLDERERNPLESEMFLFVYMFKDMEKSTNSVANFRTTRLI